MSKFILSKAQGILDKYEKPTVLDVGCATGDFLFYLHSLYPNSELTGMDVMLELLERAKTEVPGCNFIKGDVCQKSTLPNRKFDVVFMNGVHSIFDDIHPWLENMLSLVDHSNQGMAFIFGIFNPEDVDVLVKARYANQTQNSPWQAGWNCFSQKSIQRALEKLSVTSFYFHNFRIEIDIPRHKADPLRSWTFLYQDGTRGITNGTMILHNFMLLEIAV